MKDAIDEDISRKRWREVASCREANLERGRLVWDGDVALHGVGRPEGVVLVEPETRLSELDVALETTECRHDGNR